MKQKVSNHSRLIFIFILIPGIISPGNLHAQQSVSLGTCYGCIGDTLIAGQLHTLNIRINNSGGPAGVRYNINNGFKLYSPSNPQWLDLSLQTQGIGNFPPTNFSLVVANCVGCDGFSQDLIQFGGVSFNCASGLPPGFNDIAFSIQFRSRLQDAGKFICIDSSYTPPGGTWLWASPCPSASDVKPSWSGAKCFRILSRNCFGSTGNVDCDQMDSVDIADLTVLVDHLFGSFAPLCLPGEGNVDGDPLGSVDVGDLTRLVDHLFISFAPLAACS